jgi:hypothetical protein
VNASASRDQILAGTPVRFWARVDRRSDDECWAWTGSKKRNGYGEFMINGHRYVAHRWLYEQVHGQVAEGFELDHLCRNPACVNPGHLEPVTRRENQLRGNGVSGINARKTHCPQGHPYDEANTVVRPTGRRDCRICKNERNRKSWNQRGRATRRARRQRTGIH